MVPRILRWPLATALSLSLMLGSFGSVSSVFSSSHREAPMTSQNPAADATDLYAWMTAGGNVTIAYNNYPLIGPGAGPNYYNFSDKVVYAVHMDNNGDAMEDMTYAFKFKRTVGNGGTFLYNVKPMNMIADSNVQYTYNVYLIKGKFNGSNSQLSAKNMIAQDLPVAPPAIGSKSQPDYAKLAAEAVKDMGAAGKFFAGPRDEPFFVDLKVFDLLNLGGGMDSLKGANILSIVFEVPKSNLATSKEPVVGVWGANYMPSVSVMNNKGGVKNRGKMVQVSRLGMPLVNEVVVPLAAKDYFNASHPHDDAGKNFAAYGAVVTKPELAGLLKAVLGLNYGPNGIPTENREDLVTVFLTGVPQLNQPAGVRPAEMLRLNTSIAANTAPNRLGVFGGDTSGFPNGRRLADDVTDIAIQAVAGKLVTGYTVPAELGDAVNANDMEFSTSFPYLAGPHLLK
jgi:hypothetical protein